MKQSCIVLLTFAMLVLTGCASSSGTTTPATPLQITTQSFKLLCDSNLAAIQLENTLSASGAMSDNETRTLFMQEDKVDHFCVSTGPVLKDTTTSNVTKAATLSAIIVGVVMPNSSTNAQVQALLTQISTGLTNAMATLKTLKGATP